jgi:pimeloyl-ACP methyl ester carboxylesterase
MMSRKNRILFMAVFVIAVLGFKLFKPKPDTDTDKPSTADAAPLVVEPAKPRMLGTLAFTPCNLRSPQGRDSLEAQCATLEVPENRGQADGRKIALNIAWLPASSESNVAPDPVFFLAGGPGQSAVETYPMLDPLFKEIRKHRNVILVDQRGTGKSNLLTCEFSEDDSATFAQDASPETIQAATTQCLQALSQHADLRFYTTTDAVADLDAVREAIGAAQINLVGVSYGTRVAQQYAMRHPQAMRSMVIDSVVPNTLALGNIIARNLDDALTLQFAQCGKTPACKDKLGDPRAELDVLLKKLRAQPVTVRYRDATTGEAIEGELRAENVAGLVRMYAYMPLAAALLPKLIHEANAGRYDNLMALSKMLEGQMKDAMAMGMQLSVICSEDGDSMVSNQEDADTVLGNAIPDSMTAMCKVWPKGDVPADFHQPLATDVPTLALSGEFDPITPPRYGDEVVKLLPNARHFVLRGQGHNVIGAGCMPKLFAQFIEKADAKTLDGKCLDSLNYVAPFTSFNGTEP